jgi:putative FmdB family regulatory protein
MMLDKPMGGTILGQPAQQPVRASRAADELLGWEVLQKMPIYEYECTQCGRIEEVFQKFSDKPLKRCPHCSGKLHKLISQSTFHLKGSGWYATDYAGKSGNSAKPSQKATESKSAKPKSSDTGTAGDTASSSKTATKSD